MSAKIGFRGPARYRIRSMFQISEAALEVTARRLVNGAERSECTWFLETGTRVLRKQLKTAFKMKDIGEARRYLDTIVVHSPQMHEVRITPVLQKMFRGDWYSTARTDDPVTMLYLHGGGYSFYPQAYGHFIGLVTAAARSRTFALDYRLAPRHRFPAQLEDALNAYRWLLENETSAERLVIAGDSAGGNLALALLLAARDADLPLPALTIALSPATDFAPDHIPDHTSDWIDRNMLVQWADWYCEPSQRRNPLVSPIYGDLRGLPPIYLQAGRGEILYDSIQAFADRAREQGVDAVLESWKNMGHMFQVFGRDVPQSAEALQRMAAVIDCRLRRRYVTEDVTRMTGGEVWTAEA